MRWASQLMTPKLMRTTATRSQVVAQALVYKGDSLLLTGHGAEARASFQEARELFSKEDDRTQAALMLTRMGVTLHEQSQLEEAIGHSHAFAVYVGSKGVVN